MSHIENKTAHIIFDGGPARRRKGLRIVCGMVLPVAADRCNHRYQQDPTAKMHEFTSDFFSGLLVQAPDKNKLNPILQITVVSCAGRLGMTMGRRHYIVFESIDNITKRLLLSNGITSSEYTTKELSKNTWPEFERLFSSREWVGLLLVHAFSPALRAAQEQVAAYQGRTMISKVSSFTLEKVATFTKLSEFEAAGAHLS